MASGTKVYPKQQHDRIDWVKDSDLDTIAGETTLATIDNDGFKYALRSDRCYTENLNALATTDEICAHTISGLTGVGTTLLPNLLYLPSGRKLGWNAIVNQTAIPTVVANGLQISGDGDTDDEGFELYSHQLGASGTPFTIGTDAAFYFTCKFEITDVSGTDTFLCGFRSAEYPLGVLANYADYAGLGCNTAANPMVVKTGKEIAAGGATYTDTTQTMADTRVSMFKTMVSAAGVVTFQHDLATQGTLATPTAVGAATFDTGTRVVPFFHLLNSSDVAGAVIIHSWEVGYQ